MPTILRLDGFKFVIWPRDHPPPHVHVFKAGTEVIIELGIEGEWPSVRETRGMSTRDITSAFDMAILHNKLFMEKWANIHKI